MSGSHQELVRFPPEADVILAPLVPEPADVVLRRVREALGMTEPTAQGAAKGVCA
jgi:hypothetical protein